MIIDAQLKAFRDDGYFLADEMFTAQEIDVLVEHIEPFVQAHETHLKQVGSESISRNEEITFTVNLAEKDAGIQAFIRQPKLVDIATTILGPDVSLYWDQAVYKRPGTKRDFPWHQDNGYKQVLPENYLTCWLALEDAYIENGSIWVMPGTHQNGLVEHRDTPIGKQCYFGDEPGRPVELKKGGMAFFSSLLFHRSGPNLSTAVRKAFIIQYAHATVHAKDSGESCARFQVASGGVHVKHERIM